MAMEVCRYCGAMIDARGLYNHELKCKRNNHEKYYVKTPCTNAINKFNTWCWMPFYIPRWVGISLLIQLTGLVIFLSRMALS